MLHVQVLVAMAAWLVQPPLPPMAVQRHPAAAVARSSVLRAAAEFANDGEETDWDEEAKKLGDLAKPMNRFYKEISGTEAPELIKDFVNSAPSEVQFAVKTTVSALLGNLPAKVAESTITTTGKNLATLMFNMQITGYMFRNAEFKRSLVSSLDKALEQAADEPTLSLPPVSGQISVKIAEGMQAEVDAGAYMAELRSEVEELRGALAKAKAPGGFGEAGLIQYIQNLDRDAQSELTQDVSADILEAMSQLVATILIDLNVSREMETEASADKVRELLIWQLVSGYKLRELEVRDGLKESFWGADGQRPDGQSEPES